jgi:hypothetical protein
MIVVVEVVELAVASFSIFKENISKSMFFKIKKPIDVFYQEDYAAPK